MIQCLVPRHSGDETRHLFATFSNWVARAAKRNLPTQSMSYFALSAPRSGTHPNDVEDLLGPQPLQASYKSYLTKQPVADQTLILSGPCRLYLIQPALLWLTLTTPPPNWRHLCHGSCHETRHHQDHRHHASKPCTPSLFTSQWPVTSRALQMFIHSLLG